MREKSFGEASENLHKAIADLKHELVNSSLFKLAAIIADKLNGLLRR